MQQRLRHWLPRQVQQAQLQQGLGHRQHAQHHQPAVQQQMGVQQQMPVRGQLPQKLKFSPGPNQSQAESQRALATQKSYLNSDAKPFVGSARPAASASPSASAVVPVQGEAAGSDISRAGSGHLSDGGSSTAQGTASGKRCQGIIDCCKTALPMPDNILWHVMQWRTASCLWNLRIMPLFNNAATCMHFWSHSCGAQPTPIKRLTRSNICSFLQVVGDYVKQVVS